MAPILRPLAYPGNACANYSRLAVILFDTDVGAGSRGEPNNPEESSSEELNFTFIFTLLLLFPQLPKLLFSLVLRLFIAFVSRLSNLSQTSQSNQNESRGNTRHANTIVADACGLFCLPRECMLRERTR